MNKGEVRVSAGNGRNIYLRKENPRLEVVLSLDICGTYRIGKIKLC